MKERLGAAFEQMDNSISRIHGGTGLGFAISKRIVEMMNGSIEVETELGKGSRFICTVQVGLDSIASQTETVNDSSQNSSLAGRHILVVDDVEINRDIIIAFLEDTGALVEDASDGKLAVEMASRKQYDMILMDLHMPGIDGFEATRLIRASGLPGRNSLPILAVTADSGGDVLSRCHKAGMNGLIGKPVDGGILIVQSRRIYQNRSKLPGFRYMVMSMTNRYEINTRCQYAVSETFSHPCGHSASLKVLSIRYISPEETRTLVGLAAYNRRRLV